MYKGILGALVCLSMTTFGLTQENDFKKRLEELESRLEKLEERTKDAPSDETGEGELVVEVEELRRQVGILAEELEKMRSGETEEEISQERASALGVGPSAASVYEKNRGVAIAGYGEMLYENFDSQNQSGLDVDKGSQLDFLRAILYAGYRFNDRFLFNSEIELEHASTSSSGSASVEFAYLEYLLNEQVSARGGMLLVPMGLVNEFHEPNVFKGALRPHTERLIIPTTWRENGAGVLGDFGPVAVRAYVVNGLDAAGFSGSGLRGGRQKGAKAKATDMAFVGRVDVTPTPGTFFGGSFYRGGSGQGQFAYEGRDLNVTTAIWELHGQTQIRGWDFRGLYATAHLGDAGELNLTRGLSGASAIAERMRGGYVQAGYDILSSYSETMGLTPFYRFESVNTQDRMPIGFSADPVNDRDFHTLGLEFSPIYNIVIKGDYQWSRNEAKTGLNQFNLGLGYSF